MTLYLKARPQTVEDLDLASVREQIRKLVSSVDNIPHAFLFSGPKGTGKTSAARILAKLINCESPVKTENGIEPCNKCDTCKSITKGQSMDVIELDAASNRGIDDIRSLRESVALSPASAKRKVYIMDEAHMLTTEAANAFLKTLEEPPSHVVFILATTDPQKLPDTVRSRLALVPFHKATSAEIARQLTRVAKSEKMDMEDGVTDIIASRSDGSFRDAAKILESLVGSGDRVTKSMAEDALILSGANSARELVDLLAQRDTPSVLALIQNFVNSGGSIKDLVDEAQMILRQSLLESPDDQTIGLTRLLMKAREDIPRCVVPELALELAALEWGKKEGPAKKKSENEPPSKPEAAAVEKPQTTVVPKKKAHPKQSEVPQNLETLDKDLWGKILAETKSKNISLEALLRGARPIGFDGNTLNLAVYYKFHKERLEVDQYKRLLEGVLESVLGLSPARIQCRLEAPPEVATPKLEVPDEGLTDAGEKDIIQAAKEIFGD